MWRVTLVLFALLACGCTPSPNLDDVRKLSQWAEDFNARGVNSCVTFHALYPPFIALDIVMATGGMRVPQCRPRYDVEPIVGP